MTKPSKYFPGIISSEPNAKRAKPAGSSPALRIACPVCEAPAGSYCTKFDGSKQTIAHKRRRLQEAAETASSEIERKTGRPPQ